MNFPNAVFFSLLLIGLNGAVSFSQNSEKISQESRTEKISRVDKLIEFSKALFYRNPDSCTVVLDSAIKIAGAINYYSGMAAANRVYGEYYNVIGDSEQAVRSIQEALWLYTKCNDQYGMVSCLNGLGNAAVRRGDFNQSLTYYLATSKFYIAKNDSSSLAISYQNIGGVHFSIQNLEKAEYYLLKSLKIKQEMADSASMIPTLNGLSAIYSTQGDHKKALDLLYPTLNLSIKMKNSPETASALNNIGAQYHFLGQLDSARSYYDQALKIYSELGARQEIALLNINLGGLTLFEENYNASEHYFTNGLNIAEEIGGVQLVSSAYKGLSDVNYALGNYKESYDWQIRYSTLLDSISGESIKLQVAELQEKYEGEIKDQKIRELEWKEIEATETARSRKYMLLMLTFLFFFIVLGILFIFNAKRAKEKNKRIELEHKALRSQMNPHFIFNSLASVQQMYLSGETDLANEFMGDFSLLMRKVLENSSKSRISLKEELAMLKLYLEIEKGRANGKIDYVIDLEKNTLDTGISVPPLVLQPFVENAVWHGIRPAKRNGTIIIRIKLSPNRKTIICEIEDNGVGFSEKDPTKSEHNSKGIQITEQRLGHKVEIQHLSPGTLVKLVIPI